MVMIGGFGMAAGKADRVAGLARIVKIRQHLRPSSHSGQQAIRVKPFVSVIVGSNAQSLMKSSGAEDFRDRVLDAMAGGLRRTWRQDNVMGEAAHAHDEVEAERIVGLALMELGMLSEREELIGRGIHRDGKALIAW